VADEATYNATHIALENRSNLFNCGIFRHK
jgi:hypothetical protein